MQTPNYSYQVLSASSADNLGGHINVAVEKGWELVPGQSVTVVALPYYVDGMAVDNEWSYTVLMRTLA
jgi:hypothetical protein